MGRVVEPLRAMGAHIDGRDDATRAPLVVRGGGAARRAPRAAGRERAGEDGAAARGPAGRRQDRGRVAGAEPRSHRADARRAGRATRIRRAHSPRPCGRAASFELDVPGDPSSAAFFAVAAAITPGSDLVLEDMSCNPTRVGFVAVLQRMGADIELTTTGEVCGEPVGELRVRASALHGTTIAGDEIPNVIDEIPALAIAAAFADGVTEIRDAAELVGEGEQPHRHAARGARQARRRRRGARRRAGRARRRPRPLTSRATATTASQWRWPLPATRSTASRPCAAGASCRRRTRSSPTTSPGSRTESMGDDDRRRDRRTVGLGQVDGGAGVAERPRPARARHRRDVPRDHARGARAGVPPEDQDASAAIARAASIGVEKGITTLDGSDVSREIRAPHVTGAVSTVSAHPAVRDPCSAATRLGRAPRRRCRRGRDIGTVVFPDATGEGVPDRKRRRTRPAPAARRERPRIARSRSTTSRPRSSGATRSTAAGRCRRCGRRRRDRDRHDRSRRRYGGRRHRGPRPIRGGRLMLFYSMIRWIVSGSFKLLFRARVRGLERLPSEGGYVLAPSHRSMMDIPFAAWLSRRPLRYMGKQSLFDVPVLGWRSSGAWAGSRCNATAPTARHCASRSRCCRRARCCSCTRRAPAARPEDRAVAAGRRVPGAAGGRADRAGRHRRHRGDPAQPRWQGPALRTVRDGRG